MGLFDLLKEDLEYMEEDVGAVPAEQLPVDANTEFINPAFVVKLLSFLEKGQADYAIFNNNLGFELLKYVDNSDMDKVKKIKKKIHEIIMKEQVKFLERVRARVERIQVPKKLA